MDEVEDADYIYILHKGELLSHGEASELRKVHQQESVADLFRALTKNAEQDNIAGTAS